MGMYRYRQVVSILINYNISRIYIYTYIEEREKRKKKKKHHWPSAANASMHQSVYWNERLGSRVTNYIPTLLLHPFFLVHPCRPFLFSLSPSASQLRIPVSHRLSFRILKFHESRRWFLMAVRYDGAGRAPFRFSPSVLPAPPPTAKNLRCIPSFLLTSYSLPSLTSCLRAPLAILALLFATIASPPPLSSLVFFLLLCPTARGVIAAIDPLLISWSPQINVTRYNFLAGIFHVTWERLAAVFRWLQDTLVTTKLLLEKKRSELFKCIPNF